MSRGGLRIGQNSEETVRWHKISTPENELRILVFYSVQGAKNKKILWEKVKDTEECQ